MKNHYDFTNAVKNPYTRISLKRRIQRWLLLLGLVGLLVAVVGEVVKQW